MNEKPIVRLSKAQVERSAQRDWTRFDTLTDEDIDRSIAEDEDLAPAIDWADQTFVVRLVADEP